MSDQEFDQKYCKKELKWTTLGMPLTVASKEFIEDISGIAFLSKLQTWKLLNLYFSQPNNSQAPLKTLTSREKLTSQEEKLLEPFKNEFLKFCYAEKTDLYQTLYYLVLNSMQEVPSGGFNDLPYVRDLIQKGLPKYLYDSYEILHKLSSKGKPKGLKKIEDIESWESSILDLEELLLKITFALHNLFIPDEEIPQTGRSKAVEVTYDLFSKYLQIFYEQSY